MWDLILNPFITLLTLLYSILGQNVVLAIVVFTILIRVAILPLTAQQQRSSKRMQELQPELKKLQEKHKNDREKLAQEQMALYKEHGVNPFGGCLPLLIQFPILIGVSGHYPYPGCHAVPTAGSVGPFPDPWFGRDGATEQYVAGDGPDQSADRQPNLGFGAASTGAGDDLGTVEAYGSRDAAINQR